MLIDRNYERHFAPYMEDYSSEYCNHCEGEGRVYFKYYEDGRKEEIDRKQYEKDFVIMEEREDELDWFVEEYVCEHCDGEGIIYYDNRQ